MNMNYVRKGTGPPLLLVHGLGGTWRSWETVLDALAAERDVIAPDLPGFGETPPLDGEVSIAALADALEGFLDGHGLRGVDAVGTSMGARLVLELARRRAVGATVALDPGGFWNGPERLVFGASIALSVRLLRVLDPVLPRVLASPAGRTALLLQFSARPWALDPGVALHELRGYVAAPSFDAALRALVTGPTQEGMPADEQRGPVLIVWGRQDRVCFPSQAERATARFPGARLEWLDRCGHFPQWDRPEAAVRLILAATGDAATGDAATGTTEARGVQSPAAGPDSAA